MNSGEVELTKIVLAVIWTIIVPFGLFISMIGITCAALSRPLRRQERARLFLELLESGIRDGQSPERTIVDISHTHDPTLGPQFHLLAAHIESGMRLSQALAKVPKLLPRRVAVMLRQCEHTDNLPAILSVCRRLLTGASSRSMTAVNYVIAVFLLCAIPGLTIYYAAVIFPNFSEIVMDYGAKPPGLMNFWSHHAVAIFAVQLIMAVMVGLTAFSSGGMPRAFRWFDPIVSRSPTISHGDCRGVANACSGGFPRYWRCFWMSMSPKPKQCNWRRQARITVYSSGSWRANRGTTPTGRPVDRSHEGVGRQRGVPMEIGECGSRTRWFSHGSGRLA